MAIELTARNVVQELDRRIRSRITITAIETHEEKRFMRILGVVQGLRDHKEKTMWQWSRTQGLRRIMPDTGIVVETLEDTQEPMACVLAIQNMGRGAAFVVLCDFAPYLAPFGQEDAMLVRALRELDWDLRKRHISVFIIGPEWPSIGSLDKEIHSLELALPEERELQAILQGQVRQLKKDGKPADLSARESEDIVGAMAGLTEDEADAALAIAAVQCGGLKAEVGKIVTEQKREAIKRSGSLTYVPAQPVENFGGYTNLLTMVRSAAETFSPEARAYGIEPHKGFLIVGPPGCGKDYLKEVIAGVVNRPLMDMDFGSVMGEGGGIIGQAAMSIKRALKIASALKPVLGMSEFEKAVGGLASSNRSDAGETSRTIGMLLNWMARQETCMVVATANDVRQLAPEQIREGRFGAKVWMGLPSHEDCADIFRVHLRKRGRNPDDYDLEHLAESADRFSGAEIEQAVKNGLLRSWVDGHGSRELTMGDLLDGINDITPTGQINKQEIEELERWAEENLGTVSASDRALLTVQKPSVYGTERQVEI